MKRITLLLSALALCSIMIAQTFIQDTYIELGISECGTHISEDEPLVSFANVLAGLGIVSDPEQDGFTTGSITDYCGDFVMPGSPVEGFAVEYAGDVLKNSGRCDGFAQAIEGSNIRQVTSGTFSANLWKGADDNGLQIRQVTLVGSESRSIIHQVVLRNNTGIDIPELLYMRNTDPDNSFAWNGTFTTENTVETPSFGTGAAATARSVDASFGPVPGNPKCELLLLSADERASASYGNFFILAPSNALAGTGGYNLSGSEVADQAIQLTFDLGALNDGESTCLSFAYVTDREESIAAWKATKIACNSAIDDFLTDGDESKLGEALFGSARGDLQAKITAFPNPSSNSFTVDLRSLDPETCTINVFNSMGSLMFSRRASASTEPVQHNLVPGLYVVQVESNGQSYSTQMTVQ